MQSEFESKRELIYRLLKVLGGVMEVTKMGTTTTWVFDETTQKIKRIK